MLRFELSSSYRLDLFRFETFEGSPRKNAHLFLSILFDLLAEQSLYYKLPKPPEHVFAC